MTSVDVPQISLQRYVELLKRRRWQVIPVSLIGLVIGGLVAFFIPRYYVAETLIEHQAVPGQNSTRSDDPFKSIVDSAYWTIPQAVGAAMTALNWPEAKATGYQLQENERAVRDNLKVYDSNAGSSTREDYAQIRVTFRDRDGLRSAEFLNALVEAWIKKRLEELRRPSEESRSSAAERVRLLKQDQDQLVREKQGLALQHKLDPQLGPEIQYAKVKDEQFAQVALRGTRTDLDRELATLQKAQQADRDKLVSVSPRAKEDPDELLKAVSATPQGAALATQILYWRDVLQNFLPGTSRHAEAQRGIVQCEKKMLELIGPRDVDADGLVPNPEYETLRKVIEAREAEILLKSADLQKIDDQLAAEVARVESLIVGYEKYRSVSNRLAEVEKDIARALDDLRDAEAVLANLGKQETVKQRNKANAPPRPTDPNILLVAMLGCVLGLGLAISLILALDIVQGTFKTIEDVERGLPVPVLGGMSHLETEFEREQLLRSRRRISFAAAGFVFLCTAVVVVFYIDPNHLPPIVRDVLALLLGA